MAIFENNAEMRWNMHTSLFSFVVVCLCWPLINSFDLCIYDILYDIDDVVWNGATWQLNKNAWAIYILLRMFHINGMSITCVFATIFVTPTMTSSNGNIFRFTGPLRREFTGRRGFPSQRPLTRSIDVFFDMRLNKLLSKPSRWRCFGSPSRSLWRQFNALSVGVFAEVVGYIGAFGDNTHTENQQLRGFFFLHIVVIK